jgi:hypothetical protein
MGAASLCACAARSAHLIARWPLLTESLWGSKPLAFPGKLQPRRLIPQRSLAAQEVTGGAATTAVAEGVRGGGGVRKFVLREGDPQPCRARP